MHHHKVQEILKIEVILWVGVGEGRPVSSWGFHKTPPTVSAGNPFSGLGRRRWRHVSAPLFLGALLLAPPPRPSQMRSPHTMLAVELVHSLHFFFLQAHWFRKRCSDCQLHSLKERERERHTHTHTHTHTQRHRQKKDEGFFFLFFQPDVVFYSERPRWR